MSGGWVFSGDALEWLRSIKTGCCDCCVTSPPYWGLRDYRVEGQIGLEATPEEYVAKLVKVFAEVRRVLRDDGTLWMNLGDTYNAYNGGAGPGSKLSDTQTRERPALPTGYGLRTPSLKPKDLVGIPWRVAFALQADGWYLRSDIIWSKPNPMPESVTDRPTKAHEYLFLLAKSERYYYDAGAVREPSVDSPGVSRGGSLSRFGFTEKLISANGHRGGAIVKSNGWRNRRSVWTIATEPFPDAHFATFPRALVAPCILAGSPKGGRVLDPFAGSGTVALVSKNLDRRYLSIEINPAYVEIHQKRLRQEVLAL